MSNPTLSLVVIVYNVAPYLRRCLASIEAQDLADMEVIFVDDGSTDRRLRILAEQVARSWVKSWLLEAAWLRPVAGSGV